MKPDTVKWFLLLTLIITDCSCNTESLFTLENHFLTATEGSCVEIKCRVERTVEVSDTAHWFWMKDGVYADEDKAYTATIIYSTNESKRPVSPQFKNRVSYTGSPTTNWWKYSRSQSCSILICDLNKTDSGNYQLRYISENFKWVTNPPTILKITDNPCPITFNESASVMEYDRVTLVCSTINSCSSILQIYDSMQQPVSSSIRRTATSEVTHSFTATWTYDGSVFSCKTQYKTDKHLMRKVTLTVKHGPKDVKATINLKRVKVGDSVTLTCSAKGSPNVTFSWFKDTTHKTSGAELTFPFIQESESGSYFCQAQNVYGTAKSNTIYIDVLYAPEVKLTIRNQSPGRSSGHIEEGDWITLECNVIRSKPQATLTLKKDDKRLGGGSTRVFPKIKPEDSGSYSCEAKNSVGSGTSKSELRVRYKPRSSISVQGAADNKVKLNSCLRLTCNTEAHPEPEYSWYSYREPNRSNWKWMGKEKILTLNPVQKEDEACYECNATNSVGRGKSPPKCIQVLFPPTNVRLTLPATVREDRSITITCTAESFPPSDFQIKFLSSNSQTFSSFSSQPANEENTLTHTFNATSAHAGSYFCSASNSEGTNRSDKRKLNIEYSPKDVKIDVGNGLEVKENESFSLICNGRSYPSITSYRWLKMTNNQNVGNSMVYSVKSASLSDGGLYSCEAKNYIGTKKSQPVEIKIKHAPKRTTINKGNERQLSGGRQSVTLSCISHCYPAPRFVWYNKTGDKQVSHQNLTVYSNQAGEYYCMAENVLGKTRSDSVKLFDDSNKKILKIILGCISPLIILLVFFVYRRSKLIQQRTTDSWPCCVFLVCWKEPRRRTAMNEDEARLAEPFRSRDDLLPEQPCRLNASRGQPRPDVTSNNNSVHATVNLPHKNQAPSAQNPAGHQRELTEIDSVNYASLHFEKKKKKPEEDDVYSQVCKPKPPEEKEQQKSTAYENINVTNPAKPSSSDEDDSETSEDEVEVTYSEVNFKPKSGHQRATRDSSSSEEDTQYAQVKL
ncbi:B-cell receptor CD22 [Nematolebias whitei]|uniref:B-cell receptor CD22 n=1 Tax=Nematolebias whitei TaxID=451745 RepID=UPI00189B357A|nr:B-cell receptor CD22 [Nematolebias whitei]